MICCSGDVATAQRYHAENAVCGRSVPVRPHGLSNGQSRLACGGGVAQPAVSHMDARAQNGQHRLGWDAVKRLVVRGPQDTLRFVELAQVDKGGGKREQRLEVPGIRGDPGAVAASITEQLEPFADLALIPADHRAGDQGRHYGMTVVLAWGGKDGVGHGPGEFVAQPGNGLQLRGQRLVSQVARKLRLGQYHPGFGAGVAGPATGAQDRRQSAPQPGLRNGRQWLG